MMIGRTRLGLLVSLVAMGLAIAPVRTAAQDDTRSGEKIAALLAKAKGGDADSELRVAFAYETGQNVPQDLVQAAVWYRKAAEQGNGFAQTKLGLLYESGEGVPQNYTQAAIWYRSAAEQGNSPGQLNLGMLYYDGHGVPQDYAQATTWFRKAAEQGKHHRAISALATFTIKAKGCHRITHRL